MQRIAVSSQGLRWGSPRAGPLGSRAFGCQVHRPHEASLFIWDQGRCLVTVGFVALANGSQLKRVGAVSKPTRDVAGTPIFSIDPVSRSGGDLSRENLENHSECAGFFGFGRYPVPHSENRVPLALANATRRLASKRLEESEQRSIEDFGLLQAGQMSRVFHNDGFRI